MGVPGKKIVLTREQARILSRVISERFSSQYVFAEAVEDAARRRGYSTSETFGSRFMNDLTGVVLTKRYVETCRDALGNDSRLDFLVLDRELGK